MPYASIGDHGFLADGLSAVLVDRGGSVNWWCPTRFDGPSVFGRLLDEGAGHWTIRPEGDFGVERAYLAGSLVLRTVFTTPTGSVAVTDALALAPGARGHDVGWGSPRVLARVVRGLSGEVRMGVHYRPRFEYGRVTPRLMQQDGALVATAGADRLDLRASTPLSPRSGEATGTFTVRAGEVQNFTLGYAPAYAAAPPAVLEAEQVVANAVAGWRSWAGLHPYQGRYAEQVQLSALVVQGMTYRPSGAVVAAASTSLPEELGGQRNYDYRYVWVRDFSFTLEALWRTGCSEEVSRQFGWMARSMGVAEESTVPIMYGVEGERDLTEHSLEHLAGYAGSQPVLVGNDAWRQRQTDVLGEVLCAAWLMREHLDPMEPEIRHLLRAMADRAAREWRLPDSGMWEARGPEQHYVSSKVQCWTALDRAVRFGPRLAAREDIARWAAARDEVRRAVLTHGWNDRIGAFTGTFDSDDLDASALLMPLVGFLPGDDPRIRSTIRVVEQRLAHDGLLRRWADDPAGFLICSFWLVGCLALAGEPERAAHLFERLANQVNDLGLFAEQLDPFTEQPLGNFPQAFSHIGLINAAVALTDMDAGHRTLSPSPERGIPADWSARSPGGVGKL
ncbi:glycoside hydrolase family 15 protein [Micromonospora sp. CPCC 205739]|uniref:glycoside hydrolase family 15 protein n=1 Tax=Micromonospora sp. CPCC 205739 TaxID=3122404 RepID=UPI002FF435A1